MLLILAFSIGLAFVLIGIGIAMVQGARLIGHNDLINRFSLYTPVISAIVVSGLGIGLTLNALNSFNLNSAASQPNPAPVSQTTADGATPLPSFEIKQARLAYLAPDGKRQNQLTVVSLSGGKPATYTQETAGLAGYALSPDRKSIIYTVIRFDGSSSLWGIDVDGSHRHLVLDCPQAECVGPVWYPDGSKLVYERLNNPQSSTIAVFSIWWLDPATGENKPVFQDQAYPGIAPGFSPDGKWLSYISPLNNTIQLYNLKGNKNTTISLAPGSQPRIAQPWDPAGGSLLFWEAPTAGQNAPLHVKRYDLASGQRIDLGGPSTGAEFETSWSPDGQWIAITRDASSPSQPNHRQEIWLVRPDGSQGHVIVNEKQVSYSNLAWSPDSHFLVYCRYSTDFIGAPEIWLADLAGGKQTRLVTGGILPVLLSGP
jgi:Tol biopolymer transport system component